MTELELSIKSYFGIIDPEELSSIASLFQLELLKKGDYFLNTNKECDRLSFVQSGFLRIFSKLKTGKLHNGSLQRLFRNRLVWFYL